MDHTDSRLDLTGARKRPEPVHRTFRFGRGAFLAMLGVTAGGLLVKKGGLPNFSFVPGATSAYGFTIYTVTGGYPTFDAATFRLTVDGLVRHPFSLSLQEILNHPAVDETRYYQCVTGWTVPNARWTGIRLADLLQRAGPLPAAHAVKFYCFDGVYTESLTIPQAMPSDVLMAYKLMGKPLSTAQGAPLRLVVPGMYGYKFAKWVYRIELIPQPIDGYWEQNGYDRDAYIGRSNGA